METLMKVKKRLSKWDRKNRGYYAVQVKFQKPTANGRMLTRTHTWGNYEDAADYIATLALHLEQEGDELTGWKPIKYILISKFPGCKEKRTEKPLTWDPFDESDYEHVGGL